MVGEENKKIKVAFICVHNACRSQIAEALGRHFASDVFESYSGGTEQRPMINQEAVSMVKKYYEIDMNKNQHSKLIDTLPPIDIVITMGCNVNCPWLPCQYREDWGLEDPTGKGEDAYYECMKLIEQKILDLRKRLKEKSISF